MMDGDGERESPDGVGVGAVATRDRSVGRSNLQLFIDPVVHVIPAIVHIHIHIHIRHISPFHGQLDIPAAAWWNTNDNCSAA